MNKQSEIQNNENEISFRIESEEELLKFFSEKDQKKVLLPKSISYPIEVPHYYTWRESSGVYVYLVFKKPEWKAPIGLVFKRTYQGATVNNSRLCDWCLSYGLSDQVGMLSVTLNSRVSIGMMLCLDLCCIHRLEEAAELSGKSFQKLSRQLEERIGRFFEGVLRDQKEIPDQLH